MRTRRAVTVVLLLSSTVAGCGKPDQPALLTGVPKPSRVPVLAAPALPLGRESIYTLVNTGTWKDADALLANQWNLPRFDPITLPNGPTWHEDPYHDKYWRFTFYGLRPTSNLLWAYYNGGGRKYLDKLLAILRSYLAYDIGGHPPDVDGMDDPHAIAFRSMILVNSYVKLRRSGDLPADLEAPLREAIGRSAVKLESPANYQGTYNHGFTETAALLLIHANFPELDSGGVWGKLAQRRLTQLLIGVIDPDGVEVEKSPFYHFYVLDFLVELNAWASHNNVEMPAGTAERIESMVRYATQIILPDGNIPLLGSSVRLRPSGSQALYTALRQRHPEFDYALSSGASGRPPAERAVLFPVSGQAVLRSPLDPAVPYQDNTHLVMDLGRPETDHSHLEALAFTYYSHGRELLPDSGLNTYTGGAAYSYFHGNSAHNTVVVDGHDQGNGEILPGLTATGPGWAYQSGRSSAYAGVTHRRSVLVLTRDLVLVVDDLAATTERTFEQLWHLFPGAHVVSDPARTEVYDEYDNPALTIAQATPPATTREYYGATNPMQGWYSAEYGRSEPNHVIGFTNRGSTARYVTLLASGQYAGKPVTVTPTGDATRLQVTVCAAGYRARVDITNQAAPGEQVTVRQLPECGDGN